ncbi:MAG: hypothetical protein CMJ46_14515, partial [Planctomyces sp.]|nr:hypothetical protein [Planctomyces sp.]
MMNQPISFPQRSPSANWETVPLDDAGTVFWVWFKPQTLPQGLFMHIPPETFIRFVNSPELSLRRLLIRAGIDPAEVVSWMLQGNQYAAAGGTSPLLDHPVPPPAPGADPNIAVICGTGTPAPLAAPILAAASQTMPNAALSPMSPQLEELFRRMDDDWHKSMEIERQLDNQRKKMVDMMSKLRGLNRDLTLEESLAATSQDKTEWQTTRSWLRNSERNLSKLVKAFDIGVTSSAGQRLRFAELHEKFVGPRLPFDGIEQAQRDIEMYRKSMQTLALRVGGAQSDAAADGE